MRYLYFDLKIAFSSWLFFLVDKLFARGRAEKVAKRKIAIRDFAVIYQIIYRRENDVRPIEHRSAEVYTKKGLKKF